MAKSNYSEGYAHCALGCIQVAQNELEMSDIEGHRAARALGLKIHDMNPDNGTNVPGWNDTRAKDEGEVFEAMMRAAKDLRNMDDSPTA